VKRYITEVVATDMEMLGRKDETSRDSSNEEAPNVENESEAERDLPF